jgi:hypothetical protein
MLDFLHPFLLWRIPYWALLEMLLVMSWLLCSLWHVLHYYYITDVLIVMFFMTCVLVLLFALYFLRMGSNPCPPFFLHTQFKYTIK